MLDEIKINSGIPEDFNESTSGDIATVQDFLNTLIDEKYNDSLAYNIAELVPLNSSWGSIYASKRNYGTNDFKVVRSDIYTKTYKVSTGFTLETWQDMNALFGKKAKVQSGKILSGVSAAEENKTVIDYIFNNSENKQELLVNVQNSGWITSQISAKVAESVIEMNRHGFRTLDSFCILSPKWAKHFLGIPGYVKNDKDSKNSINSLFVGRYGRTDFYINPFRNDASQFQDDFNIDYSNQIDQGDDWGYVGLISDTPGESSLVFAPYKYEIQNVQNPDTFEQTLHVFNRYGIMANPLHEPVEGKSMLHKFKISEAP